MAIKKYIFLPKQKRNEILLTDIKQLRMKLIIRPKDQIEHRLKERFRT
jgi:hypothetical protein